MKRAATWLALALFAACGGVSEPDPAPGLATEPLAEVDAEAALAAGGTLLVRFDLSGASPRLRRAIEAWLGEALGQSPFLDVELGEAPGVAGDQIVVRGELGAEGSGLLTTTLQRQTGALLPLGQVECPGAASLPEALDALAASTRAHLGEPAQTLASDRRPARSLVSGGETTAEACTRAAQLAEQRALAEAARVLDAALRADPTCGLALSLLAGVRMDQGDAQGAVERARACLRLPERLSPAASHRASRTLLVASHDYEGLLRLAEEAGAARPRDWQPRFTRALGLSLLSRYAEARPELEALRARLPSSPGVLFCLGHARLGTGDAAAASDLLPAIRSRVPPLPAGRFEALVLFALGEHAALRTHLESLQRQATSLYGRQGEVELLGRRAAHALLVDDGEAAASLLLEQLDLLRGAPSLLQQSSDLLVGAAFVLSRLGRAQDCRRLLAAMPEQAGLPTPVRAHGVAAELICLQASGEKLTEAQLRHVETLGLRGWSLRLEARGALALGDAERARLLLKAATDQTGDPTLVLDLADCARALGRGEEADRLLVEAGRGLSVPRLDAPERHPLASPRLALVWREAQRLAPARTPQGR